MNPPAGIRVGLVGTGARAEVRRGVLDRLGVPLYWEGDTLDAFTADAPALDALFVALSAAETHAATREAAQHGTAVFLEWPPAPSLREVGALVKLGEEAGVEVGVSRPLRFHAALAQTPAARLIVLRREVPEGISPLSGHALADLADVAAFLSRGYSLQRIEAQIVRGGLREPIALAFSLRFMSGTYAQASLRQSAMPALHLFAAGAGFTLDADLTSERALDDARLAETRAFLDALHGRRPAPVSALDALHVLRLVERVLARLR